MLFKSNQKRRKTGDKHLFVDYGNLVDLIKVCDLPRNVHGNIVIERLEVSQTKMQTLTE